MKRLLNLAFLTVLIILFSTTQQAYGDSSCRNVPDNSCGYAGDGIEDVVRLGRMGILWAKGIRSDNNQMILYRLSEDNQITPVVIPIEGHYYYRFYGKPGDQVFFKYRKLDENRAIIVPDKVPGTTRTSPFIKILYGAGLSPNLYEKIEGPIVMAILEVPRGNFGFKEKNISQTLKQGEGYWRFRRESNWLDSHGREYIELENSINNYFALHFIEEMTVPGFKNDEYGEPGPPQDMVLDVFGDPTPPEETPEEEEEEVVTKEEPTPTEANSYQEDPQEPHKKGLNEGLTGGACSLSVGSTSQNRLSFLVLLLTGLWPVSWKFSRRIS